VLQIARHVLALGLVSVQSVQMAKEAMTVPSPVVLSAKIVKVLQVSALVAMIWLSWYTQKKLPVDVFMVQEALLTLVSFAIRTVEVAVVQAKINAHHASLKLTNQALPVHAMKMMDFTAQFHLVTSAMFLAKLVLQRPVLYVTRVRITSSYLVPPLLHVNVVLVITPKY
jgi:hypothetical protein